jgi:2-hydroxy-3-keto-5-methylthiopentenyl-1-phosphate phosphatase
VGHIERHKSNNKKNTMAFKKQTITDKIETVKVFDHYVLQVREAIQVLEDGNVISQNFHRYVLEPDADVSVISDPVIKAQFEAIMTDEVKANYQTFLAKQNAEKNSE